MGNSIIIDIAHQLTRYFDIDFLYPKEKYFFFLQPFKKYAYLRNLKPWKIKEFNIQILTYLRLPFKSYAFIFTKLFLKWPNRIMDFDAIHAHFIFPDGLLAYYICRKYHMPYILSIRSSGVKLLMDLKEENKENSDTYLKLKKIIFNASTIICHNEGYAQLIQREFGMECKVIPHGLMENEILKKPPTYTSQIHIVTAGTITANKRMEWTIQSFLEVNKKFHDLTLWVIGDGSESSELIDKYKDCKNIIFTGLLNREEVLKKMTESQIFILPSKYETYGLVYNEAASRHNAIIGTKGQGIYGILEENKEALYCQNVQELTEKLNLLLDNPEFRKSLADAALAKMHNITWDHVITEYKSLYEECISNNNQNLISN